MCAWLDRTEAFCRSPILLIFSVALILAGGGNNPAQAQDVIAFPPVKDSSTAPAIIDAPKTVEEAPAAPPGVIPPVPPQLAREAPTSVPSAPATDVSLADATLTQCTTDADCVISDSGCATVAAVNKTKRDAWRAQVARRQPGCKTFPLEAMQQAQRAVQAVCREHLCGLQGKTSLP